MMQYLIPVAIGFIAGYFSGNFGVGGGFLMQPALRLLLGVAPIVTIATPIPVIILSAITGVSTYLKNGYVDKRIGLYLAIPGMFATVAGSFLTRVIHGELLLLITAFILMVTSFRYIRGAQNRKAAFDNNGEAEREDDNHVLVMIIGAFTGLLTGLLGLGGGYIIIPALTLIFGRDMKTALGTSLFVIIAFSIPAALVHTFLGHVNWVLALMMAIGIVPGAYLGSKVAIGLSDIVLRRMFGVFLFGVSLYFAVFEIQAVFGL